MNSQGGKFPSGKNEIDALKHVIMKVNESKRNINQSVSFRGDVKCQISAIEITRDEQVHQDKMYFTALV